MKPVRLDQEAEEELGAAAAWYETKKCGLGTDLLAAVHHTLLRVAEAPGRCTLASGIPEELGVRRWLVRRFPLAVVFVELQDEVRVLAIAHGHRRPGYWRSRLRTGEQ
ncbi:MAG: type II toxin-antitoxin system RelE/ParE family toxin [Deltaproteobacteria bacterium]|nr:type II toxin-antitoxin system RelE/ParE family toxin [Deltaproteobacteria bacterium]